MLDQLIQGITLLPNSVALRLQDYLQAHQSHPLAGRRADLDSLNAWLASPKSPPYLLLTGPSGRGKSTLLVHWIAELLQRGSQAPAIAFIPINQQLQTHTATAALAALAARLDFLHAAPFAIELTAADWHDRAAAALARPLPDGRTLLVVMDGIDEAADWEPGPNLFPVPPIAGLRVIVATRYTPLAPNSTAWLHRLGWEQAGLTLPRFLDPLTREGIAEMAPPELAVDLRRLSEGEPYLLERYTAELGRSLQPADLPGLQPGSAGYLARLRTLQQQSWPSDQPSPDPAVQTLLRLFAVALGPLKTADLTALAPELPPADIEKLLPLLAPQGIIGDPARGYGFSHPRWSEIVLSRLSRPERESWEARLIAWGRRILSELQTENHPPAAVPAYLIAWYGAHLTRIAASLEDWAPLISNGWHKAWETLAGDDLGYLNDVARVAAAARQAGDLILQLRCTLILSTARARPIEIPPELFGILIATKLWTPQQGLAYIYHLPDPLTRAAALTLLAPHLPAELHPTAWMVALSLPHPTARARALTGILPTLTAAEERTALLTKILTEIRAIGDPAARAQVLADLGPALPSELIPEAWKIVQTLPEDFHQARALVGMAPRLTPAQRMEAFAAARAIPWESHRAALLARLAPYLPPKSQQEILNTLRALQDKPSRIQALIHLAPWIPSPEREKCAREALATLRIIQDDFYRAQTIAELGPGLSPELAAEAVAAARSLERGLNRTVALIGLARHLPSGLLWEALTAAHTVTAPSDRIRLLVQIAPCLEFDERNKALEEALNTATAIGDQGERAGLLAALVPYLSPAQARETLTLTRTLDSVDTQTKLLIALAPVLHPEQLSVALAIARSITRESWRARALAELAVHLAPAPERSKILMEALAYARATADPVERAAALLPLALHLSPELQRETRAAIQSISEDTARADRTFNLAHQLTDPETRLASLREATTLLAALSDEERRTEILHREWPHLPPELQTGLPIPLPRDPLTALIFKLRLAPPPADTLKDLTLTVARLEESPRRARLLEILAPYLVALPEQAGRQLWQELLEKLAHLPRPALLNDLKALIPFLAHLDPALPTALAQTVLEIRE